MEGGAWITHRIWSLTSDQYLLECRHAAGRAHLSYQVDPCIAVEDDGVLVRRAEGLGKGTGRLPTTIEMGCGTPYLVEY